ncbi:MAG TPA: hypothetical protein VL988_02230 [Solirubrobacteraceae bacterium]|nr:hypothetical protein [Solirubrobacteraceae bacterium]
MSRRSPLLSALLGAVLLCAVFVASAAAAKAKHAPVAVRPAPSVTVSLDGTHPGQPVPQDFLGLSFEMSSLPQMARYGERGDLVAMLRSLGTGVLRFGGVSADTRIAWTDQRTPRPAWASGVVDADDFRQLAVLASRSGWHVVLTLGIVHFEPRAAAREAAAAKAALGPWLEAFELGNEPNSYALHDMREEPWGFAQYNIQAAEYRAAIEAVAPGVPLWGPDVSGSSAYETWGAGEAVDQRPALLTGHHYPLGCAQRKPVPSVTSLLSNPIWRREVGSVRRYVAISQAGGIPFRMDETNSVSCGGVAGISNTFASALWAAGYLPKLMSSGAVGVNLHGAVANCKGYSPVCAPGPLELSTGELRAQPEWYALLMTRELVGTRPLPTAIRVRAARANVHAMGFLAGDGSLRVLVVNDDQLGTPTLALRLRVSPGVGAAGTLALTGSSLHATEGVELGESEVAPEGGWAPRRFGRAVSRDGVVATKLPAASAVLLDVPAPATPAG